MNEKNDEKLVEFLRDHAPRASDDPQLEDRIVRSVRWGGENHRRRRFGRRIVPSQGWSWTLATAVALTIVAAVIVPRMAGNGSDGLNELDGFLELTWNGIMEEPIGLGGEVEQIFGEPD